MSGHHNFPRIFMSQSFRSALEAILHYLMISSTLVQIQKLAPGSGLSQDWIVISTDFCRIFIKDY